MPFAPTSAVAHTPALTVSDVTARCILTLASVPYVRMQEGFSVPSWVTSQTDELIPQAVQKLYVTDDILTPAHDRVATMLDTVFPNYRVKIFQIEKAPDQLLLVAVSNELEIDPGNKYPRSLPFLVYTPPSPQDTPAAHRKDWPQRWPMEKDSADCNRAKVSKRNQGYRMVTKLIAEAAVLVQLS